MPNTITHVNETWKKEADGTMTLVASEEVVEVVKTQEELIAEKEAELLKMYEELQTLKQS